jgi:hypothetical protein
MRAHTLSLSLSFPNLRFQHSVMDHTKHHIMYTAQGNQISDDFQDSLTGFTEKSLEERTALGLKTF